MTKRALLAGVLVALALPARAQEVTPTPTPASGSAEVTPETSVAVAAAAPDPVASALGWRDTGLVAPLVRWHAGVSTLGAASDRFGGGGDPGWLVQIAPKLLLERPPARVSGWLSYEPAVQARAGLPVRARSPFDLEQRGRYAAEPSELETKVQHQGSVGMSVGDGSGARGVVQARHAVTLDQLRSEQEGLVENVQSQGKGDLEWLSPDRGTLGAHAAFTRVRYPLVGMRVADFDRVDASLDANARVHLRMTGALAITGSRTTYRFAKTSDGDARTVDNVAALARFEAQPMPSLGVRASAGPAVRMDPDPTYDFPLAVGATLDFRRRYRASLDAGTALEDSLWRRNHHVRVVHGRTHLGAELRPDLTTGLFAGVALADYPRRELDGSALRDRNDLTWGAGGEVSCQPGGRFRATLSVSHMERRSTFSGYEWEENRCVLTAFVDW